MRGREKEIGFYCHFSHDDREGGSEGESRFVQRRHQRCSALLIYQVAHASEQRAITVIQEQIMQNLLILQEENADLNR